jgi:hypothetical protein
VTASRPAISSIGRGSYQPDEAEGIEERHVVDAGPEEGLGGPRVLGAVGAVVLESLEAMLAAGGAGLLGGMGKLGKVSTPSPRASAVRAAPAAPSMVWKTAGSCARSAPSRN